MGQTGEVKEACLTGMVLSTVAAAGSSTTIEGDGDPGAGRDGTARRRRVTATPSECGLELR